MSYLSDIRIRIRKKDYCDLVKKFNDKIDGSYLFGETPDINDIELKFNGDIIRVEKNYRYEERQEDGSWQTTQEDMVYFGWDGVKWYEEYEDIGFIMEYIKQLDLYSFARIGEDLGDVEQESSKLYDIGVYTAFDENETY